MVTSDSWLATGKEKLSFFNDTLAGVGQLVLVTNKKSDPIAFGIDFTSVASGDSAWTQLDFDQYETTPAVFVISTPVKKWVTGKSADLSTTTAMKC